MTDVKRIRILFSLLTLVPGSLCAAVLIPTVYVGNPGNANDGPGVGSVGYGYYISTYEITNAQYTAFLNSVAANDTFGLYNPGMGSDAILGGIQRHGSPGSHTYTVRSGFENKPVGYVSFWDAARFANWLTNGQPTGAQDLTTTEEGTYSLGGVYWPVNTSITRNTAVFNAGGVAIPNEGEWHKAAFFDPSLNSGAGGYWRFPTRSNSGPIGSAPTSDFSNRANISLAVGEFTEVGAYTLASSAYGTFDQLGNAWEFTETIVGTSSRGVRGGNFGGPNLNGENTAISSPAFSLDATMELNSFGFRVTSLTPIPEPRFVGALMGAAALLLVWRFRPVRSVGSKADEG